MSLFVCQFGIKLQFKVHNAQLFSHFLGLCMYLLLMTKKTYTCCRRQKKHTYRRRQRQTDTGRGREGIRGRQLCRDLTFVRFENIIFNTCFDFRFVASPTRLLLLFIINVVYGLIITAVLFIIDYTL